MFKKISGVVNYTVTKFRDTDGDRDRFHKVIEPRYPICGNLPVLKKTYDKWHKIGIEK